MKNRSVPADIILPHVVYQDVARAVEWLTRSFGLVEHYRYGDPAQAARMHRGDAWIMLSMKSCSTNYGERQFVAEDIEGRRWPFAEHARDVDPSE